MFLKSRVRELLVVPKYIPSPNRPWQNYFVVSEEAGITWHGSSFIHGFLALS
jgi:hypothetical protein